MVQQLPLLTSCSIAGAIALLSAQPAWAEANQVTDVTVNPAKRGIEVILQTTNPTLSKIVTSTYEKTYITELTNTQLRLESGKPFNVSNPANGIANVTVTSLNASSVRIVVIGIDSPPAVKIEQSNGNLVLTVAAPSQTSATAETQEPTRFGSPTFKTVTTPSSADSFTQSYSFSRIANTPISKLATLAYGVDISQDNSSSFSG